MATLYELTHEFKELYENDEVEETALQTVATQIQLKGENIAKLLRSWEADETAIQDEINKLSEKKKILSNRREALKVLVKQNMEFLDLPELRCGIFKFKICNNGGQTPIEILCEPEQLPEKYQRVKIDVDRKAILEDYEKSGVVPNGVKIGERGTHLRLS